MKKPQVNIKVEIVRSNRPLSPGEKAARAAAMKALAARLLQQPRKAS
jgi:hypothetical protein